MAWLPWLSWLHRWSGALLGLLLAAIGLTGTLLLWKQWWMQVPGVRVAPETSPADLSAIMDVAVMMGASHLVVASKDFGLHRIGLGKDAGAYLDSGGVIVAQWDSIWARPELWLFDFHHYLFLGDSGATLGGILGLVGLGFIVSGCILWWRTRSTFAPRLLPRRLSRPAILRHHRDMGVVLAPLLAVAMLTGAMLALRPVATLLLGPLSPPGAIADSLKPPSGSGGALSADPDWPGMLQTVEQYFPGAHVRMIILPREPGGHIAIRVRQHTEWHQNGRTTLWFDAADGRLAEARDALALPAAARAFNALYPLHAAGVGGLAYKLAMTIAGLGLTLLGSLAVWSFWRGRTVRRIPVPA